MWILNWWHGHQRRIDLEVLWPACVKQAPDLDQAKAAFALHAFQDPAWLDLGEPDLRDFIDRLEAP